MGTMPQATTGRWWSGPPTYHLDGDANEKPLGEALAGHPDLVAEAFGVEADRVAAYLRHTDVDKPRRAVCAKSIKYAATATAKVVP